MNRNEIFEMIINHICEVIPDLKGRAFHDDDQLKDLGANSIDRAEIATMALESLSLRIPRIELTCVSNIGGLADLLFSKMQNEQSH